MEFTVTFGWLAAVVLVSIRLGAIFLLSPLFSVGGLPVRVRVMLVWGLAVMLVMALNIPHSLNELTVSTLAQSALFELFLGSLMAFGMHCAFATFHLGGRILDFQVGFGAASLIDPMTDNQNPLLGTLLHLLAVVMFFLVNGHHLFLKGLAYSFEKIPPGSLTQMSLAPVLEQFGLMFIYGVAVVAPAVFALFLVDVGMAVAARTMPQVNVFIISMPLKVFVGLVVLAMSLTYMGPLMMRIYDSIFRYWMKLLG